MIIKTQSEKYASLWTYNGTKFETGFTSQICYKVTSHSNWILSSAAP